MTRALTRAVFRGALATAIVALALSRAGAESLVTAVSSDTVSIESNFTGTEIVVFGTIERDARTVSRRRGYDILIGDGLIASAGARIAAQSGVMRDVPAGASVGGTPAQDLRLFLKRAAHERRGRADKEKRT